MTPLSIWGPEFNGDNVMNWKSLLAMLTLLTTTTVGTVKLSAAEKFDPNAQHQLPKPDGKPADHGLRHASALSVLNFGGVAEVVRLQKTQNSYEFGYPKIKT